MRCEISVRDAISREIAQCTNQASWEITEKKSNRIGHLCGGCCAVFHTQNLKSLKKFKMLTIKEPDNAT